MTSGSCDRAQRFLLVLLALALPASAEMSVRPARLDLTAAAGEAITTTLAVAPASPSVSIEPFHIDPEGNPHLGHANGANDLSSWITVQADGDELQIRVAVPREARGTYWCAIVVADVAPRGSGAKIVTRMIVPLFVTVEGTEERRVGIHDLRAVQNGNDVIVSAELHNEGNTVVRVPHFIALENESADVELAADVREPVLILPRGSRRIVARLSASVAAIAAVYATFGETTREQVQRRCAVTPN